MAPFSDIWIDERQLARMNQAAPSTLRGLIVKDVLLYSAHVRTMDDLRHAKASFLRGGAAFIGGFIGRLAFWKAGKQKQAEGLLLNSLLASENKWESEGLIPPRTAAPRGTKTEFEVNSRR